MDPDLALSLGVIVAAFSVPSILSALTDKRAPRASALTVLIGGGLVLYAMSSKPGGYAMNEIPDVIMRSIGQFF